MSTYMQALQKSNPAKYADRVLVGNDTGTILNNMIRALSIMEILNTPEENARLLAAKRLRANRY